MLASAMVVAMCAALDWAGRDEASGSPSGHLLTHSPLISFWTRRRRASDIADGCGCGYERDEDEYGGKKGGMEQHELGISCYGLCSDERGEEVMSDVE